MWFLHLAKSTWNWKSQFGIPRWPPTFASRHLDHMNDWQTVKYCPSASHRWYTCCSAPWNSNWYSSNSHWRVSRILRRRLLRPHIPWWKHWPVCATKQPVRIPFSLFWTCCKRHFGGVGIVCSYNDPSNCIVCYIQSGASDSSNSHHSLVRRVQFPIGSEDSHRPCTTIFVSNFFSYWSPFPKIFFQ